MIKIEAFFNYKKGKVGNRSAVQLESSVPRHSVGHCNRCVEFEFNDKSLHTKSDSERRSSVSPLPNKYAIAIHYYINLF